MNKTSTNSRWAAVDLGSNSFHLLLARRAGAGFIIEERLKEKVQLLAGFADGCMHADSQARGLACLSRFAQRLRGVDRARISVMGTCALREADNAEEFTEAAQELLQLPVEVISGQYEAELIYAAVAHETGTRATPRLVIDIGGGSTEFALGTDGTAQLAASVNVGCVAFKDAFFTTAADFAAGYAAARARAVTVLTQALRGQPLQRQLARTPETRVFGTSGTIESVQMVLNANGWARDAISGEALNRLEDALLDGRWVIEAGLPGLAPDRSDIFPAGVAVLSACFEVLGIERLEYVDVSLLQGIICQNLLEETDVELPEDSVTQLARRFAVDTAQAARVSGCAARFYHQSDAWWAGDEECARLLRWAAALHEVGAHISTRHYHRHGAYIVKHSEMPGFSQQQQSMLALMIRGHRRSLPGLAFQAFEAELGQKLLRLLVLLRLAVILERSHNDADSPDARLSVDGDDVRLDCGPGWLLAHPLSHRELEVEQAQQAAAGIALTFA